MFAERAKSNTVIPSQMTSDPTSSILLQAVRRECYAKAVNALARACVSGGKRVLIDR
jgi:hypothetical protein